LEFLEAVLDAVRGKILKHSSATVQNFNEVMSKKSFKKTIGIF